MSNQKEIDDLAERFQKDCHKTVETIFENHKFIPDAGSVQDATNVWLFRKLAELQLEINDVKNKPDLFV